MLTAAIFAGLFFSRSELGNMKNISSGQWINKFMFPVQSSEFISSHKLAGNMYNDYKWGGYLIWKLGPERKVFIDGRALYEDVYALAMCIHTADTRNYGGWKSVLASYNVGYIITQLYDGYTGRMMPLAKALLNDKDWVPVFKDLGSVVFAKDIPENRQVIEEARRSVKKDYF